MSVALTEPPANLLAGLRRARSSPPTGLADALRALHLSPLAGGRQNAVYLWTPPDGPEAVIKLYYKTDDRRRLDREWTALTLLAAHGIRNVPAPLWIDPHPTEPAIGMTRLHGEPLLGASDRHDALSGLAQTTAHIRAVPLSGLLADLPRIDSATHYMRRLTGDWPQLLAAQPADSLTPTMQHLLTAWRHSDDAELLARPTERVLSRGDANLVNWLRTATGSACVDFEFAGCSNVAFDGADLIEHISSRAIPDTTWAALLPELGIDHTNHHVFAAARRTCALRWLAVLWKQRDRRAEEFTAQHQRVQMLNSSASPYIDR